ncbi:thiol-disulfide oxidoreductase [Solibacillus sp. R5-41]|uniref:TlpA family protein disulfide reductase n=1 Tax=Solibacillus sp. R5-41 TaxID=2048654 RepID=UPI000C126993|nr:TlpA disulfide reductase family protein [Solibacillus sp. R5-41]ATP39193.1 thiol-disulfide oxidoreductase [Solibacillus sp. R5-41]
MKIRNPMPPLEGEEVILNEHKFERQIEGRLVLIYFWSISCKQCEGSLVKLNELKQIFRSKLNILTVHMPRAEKDKAMDPIKDKIENLAIPFPVFVDSELKISDAFQNQIVPAFYLFDQEGLLRFYKVGLMSTKQLEQKISRII